MARFRSLFTPFSGPQAPDQAELAVLRDTTHSPSLRAMNEHSAPRYEEHPSASTGQDAVSAESADSAALEALGAALTALVSDSHWLIAGLAEVALSLRPVAADAMTPEQEDSLIRSGAFTEKELAATRLDVARGALQLSALENFLTHACQTISLDQACGILRLDPADAIAQASAKELLAVEIGGAPRFPSWQFDLRSASKRLPGLSEILHAGAWRGWMGLSALMAVRQSDLIGEGPMTPHAWLSDGGPVEDVIALAREEEY